MSAGVVVALSLGFLYFIGAIPAAVAAGAPLWIAAGASWIGYSLGAIVVGLLGEPIEVALSKRFARQLNPSSDGWIQRGIRKFGLPALGLLAPVTIGPQIGCLAGLALGFSKWRVATALSLGVLPWVIGIAILVRLGVGLVAD